MYQKLTEDLKFRLKELQDTSYWRLSERQLIELTYLTHLTIMEEIDEIKNIVSKLKNHHE